MNADVEDTKRICFVGQNSVQSGRAAAGLMHDILREEEGTIAVISGIETNTSLSDRIYGFCDEMKKISPKTEILDRKYFEPLRRFICDLYYLSWRKRGM